MRVWVVRHAIAVEPHEAANDAARDLTPLGRERFGRMAKWLAKHRHVPGLIWTSPLVRTQQTAEILAGALDLSKKKLEVSPLLAPGAQPFRLATELSVTDEECVAVVGHQPDMGHIVGDWIGGAALDFGKGCAACVFFSGTPGSARGELEWFVRPKQFE